MRAVAARHVDMGRKLGALTSLPYALNTLAYATALEGDFDRALTLCVESDEIEEATGADVPAWAGTMIAAWRADAGSLDAINGMIARAEASAQGLAVKTALWARAKLQNGRGHYEAALASAVEAAQHPWEWGAQHHFHELVEAAVRCGATAVARSQVDRLAETALPSGGDWALGIFSRCRALLTEGSAAESLYEEAIERLGRTKLRPELGRAHLLYGEWLRRQRRRLDARAHLRAAHELFHAMGIEGFAERARNELLATGETVRKRTEGTYLGLTPQEVNIARLAVDGDTNQEIGARLFISARTVEWHLGRVFTKLGITSRRELESALPRGATASA
jgi:DNA-binding CsgD family transcriptional regulator